MLFRGAAIAAAYRRGALNRLLWYADLARARRRGDRIRLPCCDCSEPLVAQSGSSLRRTSSVAIGRRADIGGSRKLTAWPCQPRSASDCEGHCEGASSRSNDYATAPLASWKGRLMRCTVHKAGAPPQRRRQGRCGPIRGQCAPGHSWDRRGAAKPSAPGLPPPNPMPASSPPRAAGRGRMSRLARSWSNGAGALDWVAQIAEHKYCRPQARPFRLGFPRKVAVFPICPPAAL